MNIALILQESWHITWKNPALWALALLMFLAFIPAGLLSFSFTAAASALSIPASLGQALPELSGVMAELRDVSTAAWVGIALAALILLVLTTSITLVLQAASMRGVVMAAETGKTSLRESLKLGRARTMNIVKLSLLFGLITAALGLLPSLALVLVGETSPLGVSLIHLVQQGLTPVTIVLNLVVLLVIMSVALEDFSPRAAFGRAGSVFKSGWWAFVVVFALSVLAVVGSGLIFVIPPLVMMPLMIFNPSAGLGLTAGTIMCGGLLAGLFFLFTAVFTQALYTLVYREAARLTAAPTH
jgi:hypothetical protein